MVQIPSASLMHAGRPPRLCLGVIKLASNIFCRGFWSHPMGHDSCTDSGGRGKKKLKIQFGGGKLRSGIVKVDFSTLPFPSFRSTLRLCCDHRNFITTSLPSPSHSSPLSPLINEFQDSFCNSPTVSRLGNRIPPEPAEHWEPQERVQAWGSRCERRLSRSRRRIGNG
jgi:hypothetical protein